jgi:predicted PurR-regulated permease PerM
MDSLTHQLENRTFFDSNTVYGNYANNAIISALQSVENWLMSDIPSQANLIFGYFYSSVRSIFSVVYNLVIGLILSVYILIDKERLLRQVKKMTYSILPTATAVRVRRMLGRGNRKLSGAIRGKMLDSMIIGMLCFTLLMLLNLLPWFDFPYPVLLAVIVGITNVVPFFGPFVGGFITAVLVMFDSPSKVIPYVILIVALQQFDCNYLDPHIVGGSIGLRPFWSIFACLLGSGLFGVPGFVIGPPAVAFISEIVSEWMDDRLRAKHLEEEFDIPPEEEFEDFAEKDEAFTGTLLQEETSGDETTEEHHEHLLTTGKEKIRQTLQKHKKS